MSIAIHFLRTEKSTTAQSMANFSDFVACCATASQLPVKLLLSNMMDREISSRNSRDSFLVYALLRLALPGSSICDFILRLFLSIKTFWEIFLETDLTGVNIPEAQL